MNWPEGARGGGEEPHHAQLIEDVAIYYRKDS
jgi:hypothetical protein